MCLPVLPIPSGLIRGEREIYGRRSERRNKGKLGGGGFKGIPKDRFRDRAARRSRESIKTKGQWQEEHTRIPFCLFPTNSFLLCTSSRGDPWTDPSSSGAPFCRPPPFGGRKRADGEDPESPPLLFSLSCVCNAMTGREKCN